jgi:hypothetical protein
MAASQHRNHSSARVHDDIVDVESDSPADDPVRRQPGGGGGGVVVPPPVHRTHAGAGGDVDLAPGAGGDVDLALAVLKGLQSSVSTLEAALAARGIASDGGQQQQKLEVKSLRRDGFFSYLRWRWSLCVLRKIAIGEDVEVDVADGAGVCMRVCVCCASSSSCCWLRCLY